MCVCVCVCVCVCMCVCVRVRVCMCMHTRTHTHTGLEASLKDNFAAAEQQRGELIQKLTTTKELLNQQLDTDTR